MTPLPKNARGVAAVARLEFAQALWSLRSLALGAIFVLIVLGAAFLGVAALQTPGTGGSAQFQTPVIALSMLLVVTLAELYAPIAAIFSSVDSIVSERSTRTLDMLLSRPVTRRGLALGKLLGRASYIALVSFASVLLGFGIVATAAPLPWGTALGLAVLVALLCATWAALALLLSSLVRTPLGAMMAGVIAWLLFNPFWGFVGSGFTAAGVSALGTILNPNALFLRSVFDMLDTPSAFAAQAATVPLAGYGALALLLAMLALSAAAVEVFGRQDEAG